MDLINQLEFIPLCEFIKPTVHQVHVPFTGAQARFVHIIDSRHRLRFPLISEIIQSSIDMAVLFDLEQSSRHLHLESSLNTTVIADVHTFTQLLQRLRSIYDCTFFDDTQRHQKLTYLIIDGLSAFHWDLIAQGTYSEEFTSLISLLSKIMGQFGCSVITTSYDKSFDTGMVARKITPTTGKQPYRSWSGLPEMFFEHVEHVIYLHTLRDGVMGEHWKSGDSRPGIIEHAKLV